MAVKKHTYINTNKDGFIKENRSPLSPPWMLSGFQNIGKVLVGGEDGFVEWGEGGSGSGTTNYENLENKPRLNGVELIGNVAINYLKDADITPDGKTLVLTKENGEVFNFTPYEIKTYVKSATLTENILNLNLVVNGIEGTLSFGIQKSVVDNMIREYLDANLYTKLKKILSEGYVYDDVKQEINVANVIQPPKPDFTGIFSYDTVENRYRMYDVYTIFNPTDSIRYLLLDQDSRNPDDGTGLSYPNEIPRQQFNERIFINDSMGNLNNISNFLANCYNFDQSLDFSNCKWTKIGQSFLLNCPKFNSNITFPATIQEVGLDFMTGCSLFNKSIQSLFGPNLMKIDMNFLMSCTNFNQPIDITNTQIHTIMLDNFMYNCKNFSKEFFMTNKDPHIFKIGDYFSDDFNKCFATDDPNASVYTSGFHISATNLTKLDFDNNVYYDIPQTGIRVFPFRNTTENPFKKLVINGQAN